MLALAVQLLERGDGRRRQRHMNRRPGLLRVEEQLVPFHPLAFERDCVADSQTGMPHRQYERLHAIRVPWIAIARV